MMREYARLLEKLKPCGISGVSAATQRRLLVEAIFSIDPRRREIFIARHFTSPRPLHRELAAQYGVSTGRIQQIESAVSWRIKFHIERALRPEPAAPVSCFVGAQIKHKQQCPLYGFSGHS